MLRGPVVGVPLGGPEALGPDPAPLQKYIRTVWGVGFPGAAAGAVVRGFSPDMLHGLATG